MRIHAKVGFHVETEVTEAYPEVSCIKLNVQRNVLTSDIHTSQSNIFNVWR